MKCFQISRFFRLVIIQSNDITKLTASTNTLPGGSSKTLPWAWVAVAPKPPHYQMPFHNCVTPPCPRQKSVHGVSQVIKMNSRSTKMIPHFVTAASLLKSAQELDADTTKDISNSTILNVDLTCKESLEIVSATATPEENLAMLRGTTAKTQPRWVLLPSANLVGGFPGGELELISVWLRSLLMKGAPSMTFRMPTSQYALVFPVGLPNTFTDVFINKAVNGELSLHMYIGVPQDQEKQGKPSRKRAKTCTSSQYQTRE